MSRVRPNDPCPCHSGKKYKKCCWLKARNLPSAAGSVASSPSGHSGPLVEDDLDQLSNSVIDLIRERRFDEALGVCKRLFDEYPDVVDGFDRSAMVHEARGDHGLALDFYRRALAFAESPEQRDFFDEGGRGYWRDKIRDLEAQIRASS